MLLSATAVASVVLVRLRGAAAATDTVTVQGDVPLAYVKRSTAIGDEPDRRHAERAGRRPDGAREVLAERAGAQHHGVHHAGHGRCVRPRGLLRRQEDRLLAACPTSNTSKLADGDAGLHGALEHLGIRHDDRRAGRRHVASHHQLDPERRRRPGLPAGRAASCSRPTARPRPRRQPAGQTFFALDEYERERVLNLHTMDNDGGNITQISFNQSHDRNPVVRPNGDIMFSRWEHVGMPQPLRDLPRQARRHRHVRAVRRAKPGQQLPAPARHGPGRPVQGLRGLRPDVRCRAPRRAAR